MFKIPSVLGLRIRFDIRCKVEAAAVPGGEIEGAGRCIGEVLWHILGPIDAVTAGARRASFQRA
jgi:hypothetical protein